MLRRKIYVNLGIETAVTEIKSGKHRGYPSLLKAIGLFDFDRKFIFENGNIRVDEHGIEHYPLFAAAFIGLMKKPVQM